MANARTGNTYYVDTAYTATVATLPELAIPNLKVYYIICANNGGGAGQILVTDGGTTKFHIHLDTGSRTQVIDLESYPAIFNTSIRVTTLTNTVVTFVFEEVRR